MIPGQATQEPEAIQMMIYATGTDSTGDRTIWKTLPATYTIHDGLEIGGGIPEPDPSWYEQFVQQMESKVSTAQGYANDIIPAGIFQKSWLSSPGTAFAALIIVTTWQYSGYMLLIYISGFVGVPTDLIEAARIDGATESIITKKIRLPLMVPSIVICLFLSITRTFKVYDLNLSLTAGGPYDSTKLAAMHIYTKAFEEYRYGIGQAEALILFLVMALISLTQTYIGKKRSVMEALLNFHNPTAQ